MRDFDFEKLKQDRRTETARGYISEAENESTAAPSLFCLKQYSK